MYRTNLITGILLLASLAFTAQCAASTPRSSTGQAWLQEMKTSERGPFRRIRWFCKDGAILPPKAYACQPHGGGHQHGEWSQRTLDLRKQGYYIANILAGLDADSFVQTPGYRDQLNQILIEQFLITIDDGWILRKALYYRGAFQEEDERQGARNLLLRLAAEPAWVSRDYLPLRTAAGMLSHGPETRTVTEVRQLSASLSDRDPAFKPVRNKIHVRPEAADAAAVRAFAAKSGNPALAGEYKKLAEAIDKVYGGSALPGILKSLAGQRGINSKSRGLIQRAVTDLDKDGSAQNRFTLTAALMADLRRQLPDTAGAETRLALIDAGLALESEHFAAATLIRDQLAGASRARRIALLDISADAIFGSGLITVREREALRRTFERMQDNKITLEDYKSALTYFALVPGWSAQQLRFHFQDSVSKLAEIEPMAELFTQDILRSSPLFFYAQLVDGLLRDANHQAGVRNELFGRDVGAGLRSLNPGLSHGTLRLAHGEKVSDFQSDGIYLLPETISELPPVAGILTAGEGNPLSHVQLLARNLGIPNVAVDESLIPELKAMQGRKIILAVSPAGSVRLAEDKGAWTKLFGEEEKQSDVLIRPDLEKLDLAQRDFVPMSQLRAADSGRSVGPKAAKLGELHHQYPEAVADGLTIPFGIFRELLDQPHSSGRTAFEWMVDNYRRLEKLPAASAQRKRETEKFRAALYDWILNADPGNDFRARLRKAMDKTFGKDGSYGVFVRSDTNVEDLGGFTGAGLNLTVANVVGFDNVVKAISRVWASPFTDRAFAWRQAHMDQPEHVYPAVLLLRSVNGDKSGVMVTQDIDTGKPGWISVAVNEGVGGAVDGQAAESLRVNLKTGEVKLLAQATATIRRAVDTEGGVKKLPVSGTDEVLQPDEIKQLIRFARELPRRFPSITDAQGNPAPADVEFGFLNGELKLFQIRPFLESQQARSSAYLKSLDSQLKDMTRVTINMNQQPWEPAL